MVSFKGPKKLGPCPDQSPLGVLFKISNKLPRTVTCDQAIVSIEREIPVIGRVI